MPNRHRIAGTRIALAAFACTLATDRAPAQSLKQWVEVSADASIMLWAPDRNFGDALQLQIKNSVEGPEANSGEFDRKSYLRFDLATVDPARLEQATLWLEVGQGEGTPVTGPQTFAVYGLPADAIGWWDEDTITWATAPLNDPSAGDAMLPPAVRLAEFVIQGTGQPGDLVTSGSLELDAFLREHAGTSVTLVVVRETLDPYWAGWWHAFAAREWVEAMPATLELILTPAEDDGGSGEGGEGGDGGDGDGDGSGEGSGDGGGDGDGEGDGSGDGPGAGDGGNDEGDGPGAGDGGESDADGCRDAGDADGDGFVDFSDFRAVLETWGACAGCATDFDGDGVVHVADLLTVLSGWGTCPQADRPGRGRGVGLGRARGQQEDAGRDRGRGRGQDRGRGRGRRG